MVITITKAGKRKHSGGTFRIIYLFPFPHTQVTVSLNIMGHIIFFCSDTWRRKLSSKGFSRFTYKISFRFSSMYSVARIKHSFSISICFVIFWAEFSCHHFTEGNYKRFVQLPIPIPFQPIHSFPTPCDLQCPNPILYFHRKAAMRRGYFIPVLSFSLCMDLIPLDLFYRRKWRITGFKIFQAISSIDPAGTSLSVPLNTLHFFWQELTSILHLK